MKRGFYQCPNQVYRIMHQAKLLVTNRRQLKAKRCESKKPVATQPNQWWGIDMTKVMIEGSGWQYVVIAIDWYTKRQLVIIVVLKPKQRIGLKPWIMG